MSWSFGELKWDGQRGELAPGEGDKEGWARCCRAAWTGQGVWTLLNIQWEVREGCPVGECHDLT